MGLRDAIQRLLGDAMEWRALHTQTKDQIKPELVLALACDLWAESHSIAAPTSVGDFQASLLERLRLLGRVSFPCYPVFTLTSLIAVICSRVSTFVLDRLEVCLDMAERTTDIILPPPKPTASPPDSPDDCPAGQETGNDSKKMHAGEVARKLTAPSGHHVSQRQPHVSQPLFVAASPPAMPTYFSSFPTDRSVHFIPWKSDISAGRSKRSSPHPPPPSIVAAAQPREVKLEATTAKDKGVTYAKPNVYSSDGGGGGSSGSVGGGVVGGLVHLVICWVMTWFAPAGKVERAIRVAKRMIFLPWKVWRQSWALARTASETVSQQTALLKQLWRWRVRTYRR
eukprot:GHVS01084678.1.p1 GENE.GHVS01084678.1~~GHVS01084678.1.p1  ORF type:complete len:340 (-),score=48.89 GHVS01084678.1:557-1576(-)